MFDPAFGLTLWQVLVGALAVACLLMVLTRRWQLAAVTAVLLVDWLLCTYTPDLPDGTWNWAASGLTDALMGLIVIRFVTSEWVSLAIAFILLGEVGAHLAFGASYVINGPVDRATMLGYWTFTHWGAWLQVWLLAFWMGGNIAEMAGIADFGDSVRRVCGRFRTKGAFTRDEAEAGK